MRFFPLLDFQYWVMSILLGVVAAILVYTAWASYPRSAKDVKSEEVEHLGDHEIETPHAAEGNPIPPYLIFVYIGFAIWALCYMIYVGILRDVSF